MAARKPRSRKVVGSPTPRIAPPVPARSSGKSVVARAKEIGQPMWPWQATAATYINALAPGIGWLYPEVLVEAARQNGKTAIIRPLIVDRLIDGHRIIHAAQDLKLPREMHEEVATIIDEQFREYLPGRRGIKFGVGQEAVRLRNGGVYRIVSNSRSGARGGANDLVIVDEALDLTDMEFVSAAVPTTVSRPWGQVVYFSNAGDSSSVVLRWLRERADNDPALAYLEWSADPDLAHDDIVGWLQANPAIGHSSAMLANLKRYHASHVAGGTLDVWEREHLCRQTLARSQAIVTADEWGRQEFADLTVPSRATMGLKMDIGGERASAVLAWLENDGRVALDVIADVVGHPIDVDRLGPDLQKVATSKRVRDTVYDPYTDADIARHLKRATPLTGRDYANASEKFVRLVAGRQLRVHDDADLLAADLEATIPRTMRGGAFTAIKASPEATNTTAEAAIRAAWQASAPRPTGIARIY